MHLNFILNLLYHRNKNKSKHLLILLKLQKINIFIKRYKKKKIA